MAQEVDPSFLYFAVPKELNSTPEQVLFWESLARLLFELWERTGGSEDTIDTTATGLTTAESDIDTAQTDITALQATVNAIATGSPTYSPTNKSEDRAWNCNAAVAGTGIDVADAGPANVALLSDHDALVAVVQELSDVLATLADDLQTKGILG